MLSRKTDFLSSSQNSPLNVYILHFFCFLPYADVEQFPITGQSRWLPLQVLDDTTQHSPIVIKYKEFKIEISQDVDTRLLEDLLRVLKTV